MHFISLLRRRLAITDYASLVLAPFVVVAIAKLLQAAAGILTLIERFLLLDPRLPETSGLVNESVDTAGGALGSSLAVFLLTGCIALLVRRRTFSCRPYGLILACGAYGCWLVAGICLVLFSRSTSESAATLLLSVCGGVAAFPVLAAGSNLFATARRCMVRMADEILARPALRTILYLRPFDYDNLEAPKAYGQENRLGGLRDRVLTLSFWSERRDWTFEEVICKGLSRIAPVVAIGKPGEKLPQLGAFRKYVAHEDWKATVSALIRRSRLVCLLIGTSDGLLWEWCEIASTLDPRKILLLLPAGTREEHVWTQFARKVNERLGPGVLPTEIPQDAVAFRFDEKWRAIPVRGKPSILFFAALGYDLLSTETK